MTKLLAQNHVLQAFEPSIIEDLLTLPTREAEDGKREEKEGEE